jgi:ketosteroid isomerase-like protein
MPKYLALLLCLWVVAPSASAQSGAAASIQKADKEWLGAVAAKDLERTVSFWTDDAVIQPPGQPAVVGKDAIRQYVAGAFGLPGFSLSWVSEEPVISKSGDMAYTLSTNQFTFRDSQGKVVTALGRGVVVWRRGADGRWRCAVDTWNVRPETGPAAADVPK